MKRLDRLTSILTQLQTGRKLIAENLAERYQVSSRTIYRDMVSLKEAGVPLIGEAGTGYSLVEGYKVPPVMFSPDEVITFKMAEKVIEKYTDRQFSVQFKSALDKIAAVLRKEHKDVIHSLDHTVVIKQQGTERNKRKQENALNRILAAINRKEVQKISYAGTWDDKRTQREVEPIGIYLQFNNWYLIAWCRLRNDYRVFRTDQIEKLDNIDKKFTAVHPKLDDYLKQMEAEKQLTKVVIRIDTRFSKWMNNEKYNYGLVLETADGDTTEMTFMVEYHQDIARWFLSFYDRMEILAPKKLDDLIRDLLKKMLAKKETKKSS